MVLRCLEICPIVTTALKFVYHTALSFCFIGQTSRHLKTRINEHVSKCMELYIKEKTNKNSIAVINAVKKSAIANNLVKNFNFTNFFFNSKYKIVSFQNFLIQLKMK